ncbi:MAG: hypothetical protein Q4E32_07950 [Bacteroidales bacterium]|nr:hypothetical protein [Bacteroidales bacterium]
MMKKTLLLSLLLCSVFSVSAQDLTGRVYECHDMTAIRKYMYEELKDDPDVKDMSKDMKDFMTLLINSIQMEMSVTIKSADKLQTKAKSSVNTDYLKQNGADWLNRQLIKYCAKELASGFKDTYTYVIKNGVISTDEDDFYIINGGEALEIRDDETGIALRFVRTK